MDELELTPQFRVEYFLDAIVNSTDCPYEARDRIEMYLERIAGADIVTPEPMYRIEFYLAKIAGDDVEIPAPQHRAEFYLAALCGEEVELPEPHDRIDYWLYQWAEGGSLPWQTFVGNPLQFNAPKAHTLRSTVVAFAPKQDLHGYDNPWPPGGGKNKADYPGMITAGAVEQSDGSLYVASANTYNGTVIFQNDGTAGQFSVTFIVKNDSTSRGIYPVIYYTDATTEAMGVNFGYNTYTTFTKVSQSAKTVDKIVFNYGTGTVKTWFYVQVESGNSPSAWTPYSNECPISGRTGVDIYGAGENLLNDNFADYSIGRNYAVLHDALPADQLANMAFEDKDTSVDVSGCYIGFVKNDFDEFGTSSPVHFRWALQNGLLVPNKTNTADGYILSTIFVYPKTQETFDKIFARYNVSVNLGSTASPYVPYTGSTTTLSFPSTVYGGTAEVAEDGTGTGSVTQVKTVVGTSGWSFYNNYIYKDFNDKVRPQLGDTEHPLVCSMLPYGGTKYASQFADVSINQAANLAIYIKDTSCATLDEFYAKYKDAEITYYLATPVPFTPTVTGQPTAVQGINTMWTDGDTLTVEAKAEAVNLSALQSLNMLLGGRYYNNGTADEPTDEEALDILLGGNER